MNIEIEEYCRVLCRQQWDEACNSLDGRLRKGSGWGLLKHLLDESGSKSKPAQRWLFCKIIHMARKEMADNKLLDGLASQYLPLKRTQSFTPLSVGYTGSPNQALDADFSEREIRLAIQELNSKSAAGPDGISNRFLRNLEDNSVSYLARQINRIWKEGRVPEEWKHTRMVLNPKPGKPLGLANLRPISLTPCLDKVTEHVVLNRLSNHAEETSFFRIP